MFKRPSSRRKSGHSEVQLNLVPILDTLVTLISFLLFSMAFLNLASIESAFPVASSETQANQLKTKPLQLTLKVEETQTKIWSYFDQIKPTFVPHLEPGKPDSVRIHQALVAIKKQFPTEKSIVFEPDSGTNYDSIISVMDAVRNLEPSDESIYFKDPATGRDEIAKRLFPEIVFGNLMGDR